MNNMISKGILILFSLFSMISYAQEVKITDKNNNPSKAINPDAFDYIDKQYELQEDMYIATLNGFVINSGKSILSNLFNSFWQKANELGANSFRIEDVKNDNDTIEIEISVYNLTDIKFDAMVKLYPTNMVYVIGDIDKRQTPKKIKFNNEKLELAPMEFIAYQNEIDKDAILSIGGFLGAKVWIKGQENRLPKHLSLSGFGVGPGRYDEISISFNTGRIYPVDLNFGQFLIDALTERR